MVMLVPRDNGSFMLAQTYDGLHLAQSKTKLLMQPQRMECPTLPESIEWMLEVPLQQ
jgi:hypothetical protein